MTINTSSSLLGSLYDLITRPFMPAPDHAIIVQAKKMEARKIVDLCCGTGRLAIKMNLEGFRVKGVDTNEAYLATAAANSPGGIDFFTEDATKTHFESSYADMTIISFGLHAQNPEVGIGIFSEAMRITRRGGVIAVLDYMPETTFTLARTVIGIIERLAGGVHYGKYRRFISRGGLPEFLRELSIEAQPDKTFFTRNVGLYFITKQ
ncbi:MAG: class I SAM-dependent methyltransferase [Desulfovibrio sp.]